MTEYQSNPTRKCICSWEKCHQWCKIFKNHKDIRGGVFHLYLSTKSEKAIKWSDAVLSSLGADTSITLDRSHIVARHHWSLKQLELFDKTGPKKLYPSTPVKKEVYLNSTYKFEDRWKIQPKRKHELSSKWRYFQVPNMPEHIICKEISQYDVKSEEMTLVPMSAFDTSTLICPEILTREQGKSFNEGSVTSYPSSISYPLSSTSSPPTSPSILLEAALSLESTDYPEDELLDEDNKNDRRRICICSWEKCNHYSKIFEDANDIRAGSIQLSLTTNTDKSKKWRDSVIETLRPTTARRTLFGRNSVARLHWSIKQLEYFDTMTDGPKRYPSTPISKEVYADTVHSFDDRWKIKYYLGTGWYYFHVPNVPEAFIRKEIRNRNFFVADIKLDTNPSEEENHDETDSITSYSSSPPPQAATDSAYRSSHKTCICNWNKCMEYNEIFLENKDARGGTMTLYLSTRSDKSKKWRDSVIECLGSNTTNKRVYNVARHHWSQKQLECFDRVENGCKRYYPSTPVTKQVFLNTVHAFDDRYKVKLQTSSEWRYFHIPNVPEHFILQEISKFGDASDAEHQQLEDMPLCGFHPAPIKNNGLMKPKQHLSAFAQLVNAASVLDDDINMF